MKCTGLSNVLLQLIRQKRISVYTFADYRLAICSGETTPCQPQCSEPDRTAETRQKMHLLVLISGDTEQWHSANATGSTDGGIRLPRPDWRFRGKINFCSFSSQTNSRRPSQHSRYIMTRVRQVLINRSSSSISFSSRPDVNDLQEKLGRYNGERGLSFSCHSNDHDVVLSSRQENVNNKTKSLLGWFFFLIYYLLINKLHDGITIVIPVVTARGRSVNQHLFLCISLFVKFIFVFFIW